MLTSVYNFEALQIFALWPSRNDVIFMMTLHNVFVFQN